MTNVGDMKEATIVRLDTLRGQAGLSEKARETCTRLIEKLRAPVRIGIFGLPGAGKCGLLNALCGTQIVAPGLDLPTLELSPGQGASTEAMLPDGSYLGFNGLPGDEILRQQPVFLRLTAQAPRLAGRRYLLVVSEDSVEDLRSGMAWAAARCDMTLWCTHSWTHTEQQAWQAAPDALRNHALLIFTRAPAARGFNAEAWGFDAAFDIAFGSRAETDFAAERLAAHLAQVIDEAVTQDIHAAHLFLQRHAAEQSPQAPASTADAKPAAPTAPVPDSAPASSRPQPAGRLDAETGADLARLFQSVRRAAEEMRQKLLNGALDPADPDRGLTAFEDVFESLAERTAALPRLEETCPEVCDTVNEARDMALLLRIEGGVEQVCDAARLLFQVRQDIEMRLAA